MIKNIFYALMLVATASMLGTGCKPKDADIQKKVEVTMSSANIAQLTVAINEGIVAIGGQAADETARTNWEEAVKGLKGVKSLINNLSVAAPVVIEADPVLAEGLNTVLKAFKGVEGSISEGVISLSGKIKRDNLADLMQKLQELKPKKVVSDNLIKE